MSSPEPPGAGGRGPSLFDIGQARRHVQAAEAGLLNALQGEAPRAHEALPGKHAA